MISHLFGHKTRRVTCASSPGGRKGRHLGRENRDKGWAERGRRRSSSWDAVADSERQTLTAADVIASLRTRQADWREGGLLFSESVPLRRSRKKRIQHGWVIGVVWKTGRNVNGAGGQEDGAWEERGRRGRMEGQADGGDWQELKNVI